VIPPKGEAHRMEAILAPDVVRNIRVGEDIEPPRRRRSHRSSLTAASRCGNRLSGSSKPQAGARTLRVGTGVPIGRSRQPSLLPDPRPDASRVDARLTHAGTLSRGRFSIHVDGFLSRWPIGATREMFGNTHRCFCTCGDGRCTARLHWLFGRRLRAATGTVFVFGRSHENSDTAP
jgi:hypothetical protein